MDGSGEGFILRYCLSFFGKAVEVVVVVAKDVGVTASAEEKVVVVECAGGCDNGDRAQEVADIVVRQSSSPL